MFVGAIFNLEKFEKNLEIFKFCHGPTLMKWMENFHKLYILFYFALL
jgi:hypothetical protein